MSSLTTISSSMEESLSLEAEDQLVDTRLSLGRDWWRREPTSVAAAGPGAGTGKGAIRRRGSCARRWLEEEEAGDHRSAATEQQVSKRAACTTVVHAGDSSTGGGARKKSKKLRLTGEQAALLEHSFRAHNILSHGEKHDLARRLGLRPRQVEVWFQNRRARTKIKQTEVDRELLRRWCERLSDENARLRQEIAEARASASVCPACSSKVAGVRMVAG